MHAHAAGANAAFVVRVFLQNKEEMTRKQATMSVQRCSLGQCEFCEC